METEQPGRREQNRRRTHQALISAAARLFQEQGYEATTVRDIAAAAGIGERTFFRYFPSKDSLILNQVREMIPLLREELRVRPAEEPPMLALRNSVIELNRRHGTTPAILLVGPGRLQPDPTRRGDLFLLTDLEDAVAEAFLARLLPAGADPADAEPELVLRATALSRAGVGLLRAVRLVFARTPEPQRAALDPVELLNQAFDVLN